MITRHILTLEAAADHPLHSDSAYRLYACLLEKLSAEDSEWIHEVGSQAVSQYLRFDRESGRYIWTIHSLSEVTAQILDPILESCQSVCVENQEFRIVDRHKETITLEQILQRGRAAKGTRCRMTFLTPTAFKQSGRYVIFPQERLILQSLMMRWNTAFPNCPLEDEDAFHALLAGIRIADYRMHSTRFALKGVRIPGFAGFCELDARLPAPLLELWNTLLVFADYAGIGIKTGLGMGGTQVLMK